MIRAARVTGCRLGELATAQRTALDHDRRDLTVIGKGNKLRVIGLDYGDGYELLRGLPAHLGCKWLFWHGEGEPYRNLSSRFAAIVREVFCTAYDARHGTDDKTRPPLAELLARQDAKDWADIGFRCRSPHQMDVHNRQSPRQNGPRLSRHTQRVIITVARY